MKRELPDSDSLPYRCEACSAKRRKIQCADFGGAGASPPSQPLAQIEATIRSTQQSTPKAPQSSVQQWAESCAADCDLKVMEAPPTPRSAYWNHRGRRKSKHYARSQGSRTPSPSKRPSPQTYRTRNMYQAGVVVDELAELPSPIDEEVRRILGIESWEDQVVAAEPQASAQLLGLVGTFQADSRRNARECSLEGDWKASLFSLVRTLTGRWPDSLKAHMSEKAWNTDLKPTGSSPDEVENEYHSAARSPSSASARTGLPDFNPDGAAATATAFAGPVPSLPPHSVAPTTSTEAADPYHISTPKPDITVGLAHAGFIKQHQGRLVDHQASGSILSDPHTADMGLRFPFLVVEAKGLSLNGSLVSAQNQAAISGASMLTILKDLSDQSAGESSWTSFNSGSHNLDSESTSPSTTALTPPSTPTLCFSIVTEGPVHELWVHFEHEGKFHMVFLQSWRTTHNARGLVHWLARIVEWGRGAFKDGIEEQLNKVPRRAAFG